MSAVYPAWRGRPGPGMRIAKGIALAVVVLLVLFPMWTVVATSLAEPRDVIANGGWVVWPERFTFTAYSEVLDGGVVTRALLVSGGVTVIGTALSLVCTVGLAYALSRPNVYGGRPVLLLILFTFLFPPGMIPLFLVVRTTGLFDSYAALVLPFLVNVFNLVVLRGFFQAIPGELLESARIDGAGELTIMWRVVLPLSKAMLAVVGLFYAVAYWNRFFEAIIYFNDQTKWPIGTVLRQYVTGGADLTGEAVTGAAPQSTQMAVVVLAVAPIVCVYPFLQRYFVKGVGAGAGALATVAAPALTGCGSGSAGDVGKNLVPWPTHVPFAGPAPDAPGDESGVQPLYLAYPQRVVRSVPDAPGDGSDVTAMVVTFGAPPKPVEANQLWQAINKALNVNLKVVVVPDAEYGQKMTTLMASGDDLPDIIMFSNLQLPRSAEFIQARCADLSEFVGGDAVRVYPNLANIPPHAWQGMGRIGGRIFGVPLERPRPGNSLYVNRTALEAAGVGVDWDAEGYVAALTRLSGGRLWGIGGSKSIFGGFGAITYHAGSLGAPNAWQVRDGQFVSTLTTPQFEEALGVMRRLAEAGAYHPDSLTISTTDLKTFWYNGTVLSLTDGFGAVSLETLTPVNRRFEFDLGRPYGPDPTPWRGPGIFGYVTFKQAAPERIRLLLRICDYLSAPFGTAEYELANYGVEGVHFTKDANGITTTELSRVENNVNLPTKYLGVAPAVLYLPGHPRTARAIHDWEKAVLPKSVADPEAGLRSATRSGKGADLTRIVGDAISAIVFGRKPASTWKDTVTQWRQAGGDKVAEELAVEDAVAR